MSRLHVAVGVVLDQSGRVLVAQRGSHQHLASKWEFPGGKVEPGETCYQALCRELQEELGICVSAAEPLIAIPFDYPDKSVLLDVWLVEEFSGQAVGREGQPLRWVEKASLADIEFPSANAAIIRAILLPRMIAISGWIDNNFTHKLEACVQAGAGALILRPSSTDVAEDWEAYYQQVSLSGIEPIMHCKALRQLNLPLTSVDSVHLDSVELMGLTQRPASCRLLGASCHSPEELAHAERLGCDYAMLSPVLKTTSHPNQPPLGWSQFRNWVSPVSLPVYALGGLTRGDLAMAVGMGAQGVACVSDFWSTR